MLTQTNRIVAGNRVFLSVDALIGTAKTEVGFLPWWKEDVVKFPDKESSSSQAFVEVHEGNHVVVGYGDRMVGCWASGTIAALRLAEMISIDWLAFKGNSEEYLEQFNFDSFS